MSERSDQSRLPDQGDVTTFHVNRAVAGDHGSLSWVIERLTPLLLEQARYRLGPRLRAHHDPADLVNDAWLIVLPRLPMIHRRGGRLTPVLLKFLSTALLYRVRNLVRRERPKAADASESECEAAASRAAADSTGVVSAAVRREVQDAVVQALAELESLDREIIVLRGIEQHRNQTVASKLGLSPQAVAMRFSRALERLRERLPRSVFEDLAE